MTRYVALLRAINVGGHTVKMATLVARFEALGLERVATLAASGNVLFSSRSKSPEEVAAAIEHDLERELGYAVSTMLRSAAEIAAAAAAEPFPAAEVAVAVARNVGFLRAAPRPDLVEALAPIASSADSFRVVGRDLHWLSRVLLGESKLPFAKLERIAGSPVTWRKREVVAKLAAKATGS